MTSTIEGLNLKALKEKCKQFGLKQIGKKEEVFERLRVFLISRTESAHGEIGLTNTTHPESANDSLCAFQENVFQSETSQVDQRYSYSNVLSILDNSQINNDSLSVLVDFNLSGTTDPKDVAQIQSKPKSSRPRVKRVNGEPRKPRSTSKPAEPKPRKNTKARKGALQAICPSATYKPVVADDAPSELGQGAVTKAPLLGCGEDKQHNANAKLTSIDTQTDWTALSLTELAASAGINPKVVEDLLIPINISAENNDHESLPGRLSPLSDVAQPTYQASSGQSETAVKKGTKRGPGGLNEGDQQHGPPLVADVARPRRKAKMLTPRLVESRYQDVLIPTKTSDSHIRTHVEMSKQQVEVRALSIVFSWMFRCVISPAETNDLRRTLPFVSRSFNNALKLITVPSKVQSNHGLKEQDPVDMQLEIEASDVLQTHWLLDFLIERRHHNKPSFESLALQRSASEVRQIILSTLANLVSKQYLDERLLKSVIIRQIDMRAYLASQCTMLNPDMAMFTDARGQSLVVLCLTGEVLGENVSTMGQSWQLLHAQYTNSAMKVKRVYELVTFLSHREEDEAWPHGISPRIQNPVHLQIARRFVVCNAELSTSHVSMVQLTLGSENGVLSISMPPELQTGLAVITTSGGRSVFVLNDTGRIVGDEMFGIEPKFRSMLNCEASGRRSNRQ